MDILPISYTWRPRDFFRCCIFSYSCSTTCDYAVSFFKFYWWVHDDEFIVNYWIIIIIMIAARRKTKRAIAWLMNCFIRNRRQVNNMIWLNTKCGCFCNLWIWFLVVQKHVATPISFDETYAIPCFSCCRKRTMSSIKICLLFTVQFDRHIAIECERYAPVLELSRTGKWIYAPYFFAQSAETCSPKIP